MNPLALLILGGAALMAFAGKKKPTGNGTDNGTDDPLPDADQDDRVVEEGTVTSAGGIEYATQIWRLYDNQFEYLGELKVGEDWVSGPMGMDLPLVRGGLQELADSFDGEGTAFDMDPCAGAIEGMFTEQAFAAGTWGPTGLGITPELAPEPYTWCVVEIVSDTGPEAGTFGYEGRLVHLDTREVIFRSAPQAIADIAASMAAYAAHNPFGPFPWVEYDPGFGLQG